MAHRRGTKSGGLSLRSEAALPDRRPDRPTDCVVTLRVRFFSLSRLFLFSSSCKQSLRQLVVKIKKSTP